MNAFLRSHVSTTYLLPSSYPCRSTLLVCNNLPRWSFYVDIKIVERRRRSEDIKTENKDDPAAKTNKICRTGNERTEKFSHDLLSPD